MKRAAPWDQTLDISSDDSSGSDSEDNQVTGKKEGAKNGGSFRSPKDVVSEEISSRNKRRGGMDYEALKRHGYYGGPSVLKVPPPRVEDKDRDWSWSTGKRPGSEDAAEESYEERERTRAAATQSEKLLIVRSDSQSEKKESISFSQKEKRKRDLGQASRGKNYVEEEKRLLRDSGIYSGFD